MRFFVKLLIYKGFLPYSELFNIVGKLFPIINGVNESNLEKSMSKNIRR